MLLTEFMNFFEYNLSDKELDELKSPKWVAVSKGRFIEIPSTITEAKNNGLKTSVDGREITLDNAENLLKDIGSLKSLYELKSV